MSRGEKRTIGEILFIIPCPWKEGYALVKWKDAFYPDCYESRPIKIQQRKDGTEYIYFEGKRYNMEYSNEDNKEQTEKLLSAIFDN